MENDRPDGFLSLPEERRHPLADDRRLGGVAGLERAAAEDRNRVEVEEVGTHFVTVDLRGERLGVGQIGAEAVAEVDGAAVGRQAERERDLLDTRQLAQRSSRDCR